LDRVKIRRLSRLLTAQIEITITVGNTKSSNELLGGCLLPRQPK
jgi:hypothetical protein